MSTFTYELGQRIYFLKENKVVSSEVIARARIENKYGHRYPNQAKWGEQGTFYQTREAVVKQENAFASQNDLARSLMVVEAAPITFPIVSKDIDDEIPF